METTELAGTLASGNQYRVTPYEVTISSPDGALHRQTMTHDLRSVGRDGRTVQTRDVHGRSFDMEAASEADAQEIERVLLLTVPATPQRTRRLPLSQAQAAIVACVALAVIYGGYELLTDPAFWDIFGL